MPRIRLRRTLAQLRHRELRGLFSIQSHLTDQERLTLFRLAGEVADRHPADARIVEIGAYVGASTTLFAAGLAGSGGTVTSIDTWNNDAMSEGQRDTFAAFEANTARFAPCVRPVRGWSTDRDVVTQVRDSAAPIHLLFIDGDHSHEAVLADWETYAPMLAPNALIAMHDIGWADGVQRVVADHIGPHTSLEGRLPNLWWGRMVR